MSAIPLTHDTPVTQPPGLALVGLLATGAGLAVAALYYSQPMLGELGADLGATARQIGLVPTLTQLGYAAGIFLLAPLGDRFDRRRIVLAKAAYGNYLVLYQNATVGRHKQDIPQLGERVILYPGSAVVGRAVIEDGAVLSQGVRAINRRVPANQMAFAGDGGNLTFRPTPDDLIREYFRL